MSANTYYDGTGVLALAKITPIIRALFSDFDIDENNPGDGKVGISLIEEHTDASWENIQNRLAALVKELKLTLPPDVDASIEELLYALGSHFKQDDNELANVIENCSFDDEEYIEFSDLYDLAKALNDGHDLQSISFEGAYHADRVVQGQFGGYGEFIGKAYRLDATTRVVSELGPSVNDALLNGDVALAADLFVKELNRCAAGVALEFREELRKKIVERIRR